MIFLADMDEQAQTLAVAVAKRVVPALPVLAERMGEAYWAEVPGYASLSEDARREPVAVSLDIIEVFFGALALGREPDVADVSGLEEAGRRRLEMGVPLEGLHHAYRIVARVVFQALVDTVEAGEDAAVRYIGARWIEFVDQAATRASTGYVRASPRPDPASRSTPRGPDPSTSRRGGRR
ncbi:MAG: hypothetical protein ACRD12_18690 [Acidimicrobiales bacterium]